MMHARENRYGFGWLASQLAAVRLSGAGVNICIAGYQLSDYTHTQARFPGLSLHSYVAALRYFWNVALANCWSLLFWATICTIARLGQRVHRQSHGQWTDLLEQPRHSANRSANQIHAYYPSHRHTSHNSGAYLADGYSRHDRSLRE